MSKYWKYGAAIGGFVLLMVALLFVLKLQWDAQEERDALNKQLIEMKQLQDGIVRNQSKYVSKDDLENFAKSVGLNLSAIREDLEKFDAEIKGISMILAKSQGYHGTNIPSDGTTPKPPGETVPTCEDGTKCPDPYGYLENSQTLGLSEKFGDDVSVPIGDVSFSAWRENPWDVNILGRNYNVATVLGEDEDGRHYVYNKFTMDVDGKTYEIPVETAEFQEVYPEAEFRFDPHVNLGVDVGASIATDSANDKKVAAEVEPNVQVTFFSYGKTKINPDYTFLGVGLGYETQENTLGIIVSPVNFNIGKPIPLIDNLYVGPTVGVDIEGRVFVGAGMRVGL